MSSITIPDIVFKKIMTSIGYPFVQYANTDDDDRKSDLELNEDEIKDLIIAPVFQEYFVWFPIRDIVQYQISGNFTIDYPDNYVFGVKNARMTSQKSYFQTTSSAYINAMSLTGWNNLYGSRAYGTRNDYGMVPAQIDKIAEMQSYINKEHSFKWNSLEDSRQLVGFTNMAGTMEVTWAKYSLDWKYISYTKQLDVIKLAQGKILQYFGYLRKQMEMADIPISLDGDTLIEHGKELQDAVYDKWHNFANPTIIRG